MRNRFVIVGLMAVGLGCGGSDDGRDRVTTSPSPPEPPPAKAGLTPDEEVKGVIRYLWPHVLKADAADFEWSGCYDKRTGFDFIRECAVKVAVDAAKAKASAPPLVPKTTCGKDTEKELRGYIDRRVDYLNAVVAWLDKNKATLSTSLQSRPIAKAAPSTYPKDPDNNMGLIAATDESCIVQALGCQSFCPAPVMDRVAGVNRP